MRNLKVARIDEEGRTAAEAYQSMPGVRFKRFLSLLNGAKEKTLIYRQMTKRVKKQLKQGLKRVETGCKWHLNILRKIS